VVVIPKVFLASEATKDKFQNGMFCHYEILREEVENADFTRIYKFMNQMKSYLSVPKQKVLFTFAGYDDDNRDLINIPEVVSYTKELLKRHWYFWYYAIPKTSYFFVTAFLLDENNHTVVTADLSHQISVKTNAAKLESLVFEIKDALQSFGTHIDDENGAAECCKLWIKFIASCAT